MEEEKKETKATTIYLDKQIYDKTKRLSKQEGRSFSSQVEYIIKKYLDLKES